MQPWQVCLGLSMATVMPLGFLVYSEVSYLQDLWPFVWEAYWFHVVTVPVATVLLMAVLFYQVARVVSLGDVGSRIKLLDRSIREGRSGEQGLADALAREDAGDYES